MRHRVSDIAAHWGFMVAPLAPEHRPSPAAISYSLLEQERMPLLAHLTVDDPRRISRDDWVRLGLAAAPGRPGSAPFGAAYLDDFEARYCYDRFWDSERSHDSTATRMICSGHAFLMVGDAANTRFVDAERGILAKFDHQYFLLALIAHFHRAALMAFRDRFVTAMSLLSDYSRHPRLDSNGQEMNVNGLRCVHVQNERHRHQGNRISE